MSILMVNDWMDYKDIKEELDLTDGNLASHINGLEKLEYIRYGKRFVGKNQQAIKSLSGKQEFNSISMP